jgi:hypothetical protein
LYIEGTPISKHIKAVYASSFIKLEDVQIHVFDHRYGLGFVQNLHADEIRHACIGRGGVVKTGANKIKL